MNDVASSGASLPLSTLEAVSDALGLAIFVCDRNDELVFASRPIQNFYPVAAHFFERGTRLRDFLGAVFDLGIRSGTASEKSRRRVNRDEWISERVSHHWRERYDVTERIARQRWISVRKRRLANGLCVVSITDISEQKKKEEQVHLDMERIELTEGILDSLPNPVCVKDRSLHYVAVNKAFCALHGMAAEQILGRSAWDLLESELAEKFEASDRLVIETGEAFSMPEQIVAANGDDIWVITRKFRVGDAHRALLVTLMSDVTEIVIGADRTSVSPEVADALAIRDYGIFEPAQNCYDPFRSIDMHSLIETSSILEAKQHARPGVLLVTADPAQETRLLPILRRLGYEACSVGSARELDAFLPEAHAAGLTVDIVLADLAVGDVSIPPCIRVVRLDHAWTDSDIGMALDAAVAPDTDGSFDLTADDAIDVPSGWDILVPPQTRPSSEIDVLVAEDNDINQFVFAQILEGLGLSYRIAGNGQEAVRMWQQLRPRLVFMDVAMPVMNGFDAARAIRAAEAGTMQRTPIVAVTTQAVEIDAERARAAGMDDHIVKPVSPDMIERAYAHHGTWAVARASA